MSNTNVDITVEGIEGYLISYTQSINELRSYVNKLEQLDTFYKTFHKDLNIDDFSSFRNQLNFTGFLTISILDLLVISKNILLSKLPWERIYQLKLAYLQIYEAIDTYHRHKEIATLAKNDIKAAELHKVISDDLKAFKHEYDYPNTFKEIRNAIIAHIDADFKTYYDTVCKIKGDKYFQAVLSFLQILFKMQELSKYLSDALVLQKNGEPFNLDKLVAEISNKLNMTLDELNSR